MKELIGKKIKSISISDDQSVLSFDTDQGRVAYEAWGDCCSESWFADINGVNALIDCTVLEVNEVSMDGYNVDDGRCRQESDEAYGYKIKTDKGYADIVYRNSSNGYYGGDMSIYNGELPENMKSIEDDWMA